MIWFDNFEEFFKYLLRRLATLARYDEDIFDLFLLFLIHLFIILQINIRQILLWYINSWLEDHSD